MEAAERIKARLDNIQAAEPILSALRTISLTSRLLALKRMRTVHQYQRDLLHISTEVSPHLPIRRVGQRVPRQPLKNVLLLVIGSERGLCGAFNDAVAARAEQALARYSAAEVNVTLTTLGTRAQKAFRQYGRLPLMAGQLSATALPPYALACALVSTWLHSYENLELDAVEVIYNAPSGAMRYKPTKRRLLPPALPRSSVEVSSWPPIIETDSLGLYTRVVELWLSATLYGLMLESALAEHSARYQLLDGASQNAQRLLEELRLFLQMARQEAITSEMQDLSSGAGLLGTAVQS